MHDHCYRAPTPPKSKKKAVRDKIIELNYTPHEIQGVERQVIGAVGEDHGKEHLMEVLDSMPGVESVIPILKPYKLAGREIKSANSEVNCGGVIVGGTANRRHGRTLLGGEPRAIVYRRRSGSRNPEPTYYGEARSNPGLHPTVFRDWKKKASSC